MPDRGELIASWGEGPVGAVEAKLILVGGPALLLALSEPIYRSKRPCELVPDGNRIHDVERVRPWWENIPTPT